MSKVMKQIPFGRLMDWALTEYQSSGSLFGVGDLWGKTGEGRWELFGEKPELPFGPAAGPHTQAAQNIIAGYAAGARFFELKTVQTLDGEDLPVSKPCITAPDECYNVEWSTELYVPQAMDEYIKAWYALKLLSRELGLGADDGFVFNMSVGYDLEGIKSGKIDAFTEGLKNAENTEAWQVCKAWAMENLHRFEHIDHEFIKSISPEVCRSITLSTLHGCPPDEIERIAVYLLKEKKLHTFVKCNPTLLGYDYARATLDKLGFDYIAFDDHHFKADLQFDDAVPMFRRLQKLADSLSLSFGVKLTNTFPVRITENELPGEEMYMSGRALYPLTIEVANRLSAAFDGRLRISYSGGADARNIGSLIDAGIWPVTLATTLLKPGGYKRLRQIAQLPVTNEHKTFAGVDRDKLRALVSETETDPMYRKLPGIAPVRKIEAEVPLTDCFTAPCRCGCPINQDVPAYLRLAGQGRFDEALRVIYERNPLPFITGAICPQFCAEKCTREFYEGAVNIRDVKQESAEAAYETFLREIKNNPKSGGSVAVIGGGPAGLSAACFLLRAGRPVTVFEKKESLGGIVTHVIPSFRIGSAAIDSDIEMIKAHGADVKLNCEITSLEELRTQGFEHIIVAIGAWKAGRLDLHSPDEGSVLDALDFLGRLKTEPQTVRLFENVAVIGGGNTAMDAARAAKRADGVKNVSLIYRRTKRYMPADAEELLLALQDGVEFRELLAPASFNAGVLTCEKMRLGDPDVSGRRSPEPTGEFIHIPADTVIYATGNLVDAETLDGLGIPTDKQGRAIFNHDTLETDTTGVYIIGDAAHGPATVVKAIADAKRCAEAIAGVDFEKYAGENINPDPAPAESKKGILYGCLQKTSEPDRCLECATVCKNCVDVCPNRANIAVYSGGHLQIIHIDELCNECGNCETFCPYESAPYKDKFTLFLDADDFDKSKNPGFYPQEDGSVLVRIDGGVTRHNDGAGLTDGLWSMIRAAMEMEHLLSQNI